MKLLIQQLLQYTWFNLNNYTQTFSKHNEKYFLDNETGELYQIISFDPKHQTYLIEIAE